MGMILYNGSIYTMCGESDVVEAVYIKDNKIFQTGTNEDILKFKSFDTEVIDLNGRYVVPGFNDSHLHILAFSCSLNLVDLSVAKSIDDVINISKEFIKSHNISPSQWVIGRGWNQEYFQDEQRILNKHDLDKISTEYPVVLSRTCGHIACLNSLAIEKLEIKSDTVVDGGKIDLDENGDIAGVIRENALHLLGDLEKANTNEQIKDFLIKGIAYANSKGLTSIQSYDIANQGCGDFENLFNAYKELEKENKLTIRVYEQCFLGNKETLGEHKCYLISFFTEYINMDVLLKPPIRINLCIDNLFISKNKFTS